MEVKKVQKVQNIFHCECCHYTSIRKSQYDRHLSTSKHVKLANDNKIVQESSNKYECVCGNIYKNRHNLCRHKKTCKNNMNTKLSVVSQNIPELTNNQLILNLLQQNNELQKQIIELSREPKIINNYNNSGNNNTNNIQLNLNQFLNETCKNAINFSDFIENIQVTDDDLENNVKMGFVEGVTKIIMDNLKQLALIDRPIHCTDVKRETIYVKEEGQWDKENSHEVIQRGFQDITCKNMQQLVDWRENNPSYADDMDSELGEKSIMMQQNSMAGSKREEYYPKIIKNIAKESIISNKSSLVKK